MWNVSKSKTHDTEKCTTNRAQVKRCARLKCFIRQETETKPRKERKRGGREKEGERERERGRERERERYEKKQAKMLRRNGTKSAKLAAMMKKKRERRRGRENRRDRGRKKRMKDDERSSERTSARGKNTPESTKRHTLDVCMRDV